MSRPPSTAPDVHEARPLRVCLVGSTGTIGRATAEALARRGFEVVCFERRHSGSASSTDTSSPAVTSRYVDPTNPASLEKDGFAGKSFDVVISCMASRTGVPRDAWAIDHRAQSNLLMQAKKAGVAHFILLSAICVQKPRLAFQHAKLAFEQELIASGLRYSIVRPTAFFKSLSGQIERVRAGKPFLLFGDGTLTACKPISDGDLANYIVDCIADPACWNRILPIGGPGDAITPRQQGEALFSLLGQKPQFRSVPPGLLLAIARILATLGRIVPGLSAKAELARIGHYYATESMLLLDPETGRCSAAATPSTGSQTLFDHYAAIIQTGSSVERGDHAVF